MKYFTPELLTRIESSDAHVMAQAHDDWELALVRWRRHWQKIKHLFPDAVRRFRDERVCLHDAQVLRMGRSDDTFVMVLEMEPPARDLVILTFALAGEPEIDPQALPGPRERDFVTWMYEEWDVDRRKRCLFEVLLSNGSSIRLCFTDFTFVILPPILPARGDSILADASVMIPQPA